MSQDNDIRHQVTVDRQLFSSRKSEIDFALSGGTGIINGVTEENRESIFYMLLFCLCVPQSKASLADAAVQNLKIIDLYHCHIPESELYEILKSRVRFYKTKAFRINLACSLFDSLIWDFIKNSYDRYCYLLQNKKSSVIDHLRDTRNWMCNNINGFGMKLSSHFCRNIGMSGLCILDVHIVSGLQSRGIFPKYKLNLTNRHVYGSLETKMMKYAEKLKISVDQLDMLLWSEKTGFVFK